MTRKMLSLLLALLLLPAISLTAYGHAIPQERQDCSMELIVRYDGKDIDTGTLTAIKVGYLAEEDGNYFFCQEFTGIRLEDITSAKAPKVQQAFYEEHKEDYPFAVYTQSVKNGRATFTGLSTGLYLILQEQAADGFNKLSPFLVSVPYLENDEYCYHVTAAIKSELEREPEPTEPAPTEPKDPQLPQTGQLNWPVPVMTVAGMALFAVGWMLRFGKKEAYEE